MYVILTDFICLPQIEFLSKFFIDKLLRVFVRETFSNIYYAHLYFVFEQGTNQKKNFLICRFLPKVSSFDSVLDSAIENRINNPIRKILNYYSSAELFQGVLFDIAI